MVTCCDVDMVAGCCMGCCCYCTGSCDCKAVVADMVVLAAAASATVALPSLTCGAVAAYFAVEPLRGSAVELVPVPE